MPKKWLPDIKSVDIFLTCLHCRDLFLDNQTFQHMYLGVAILTCLRSDLFANVPSVQYFPPLWCIENISKDLHLIAITKVFSPPPPLLDSISMSMLFQVLCATYFLNGEKKYQASMVSSGHGEPPLHYRRSHSQIQQTLLSNLPRSPLQVSSMRLCRSRFRPCDFSAPGFHDLLCRGREAFLCDVKVQVLYHQC